jgi:hypothetical protein
LERIGEDEPDDEDLLTDLWEDEGEREAVLQILQADCESCRVDPRTTFLVGPRPPTFLTADG